MHMDEKLDLGHVKEGIVEIDPLTDRMVLRCRGVSGFDYFDIQMALEQYRGEEVRVVLVPTATVNRVAKMVESGEVSLDHLPRTGQK